MKELLVGNAPCSWGMLEHQDLESGDPSTLKCSTNWWRRATPERISLGRLGLHAHRLRWLLSEELAKRNHVVMLGRVCAGGV